jgi:hypothetical protein
MKKTVRLLSVLIFSFALMVPSQMWADDGKHMEEGSGKKMDKASHEGKEHSKDYKEGKGHMKEGSDAKEEHDKSANHKNMEEGSKDGEKMKSAAPKKEGS